MGINLTLFNNLILPTMLLRCFFGLITLLFNYEVLANASDKEPLAKIIVYGYSLEHRLSSNGVGQYNDLMGYFSDKGLRFNLVIEPLKRATRNFLSNKDACIFPISLKAFNLHYPETQNMELIGSDPIDRISLRIFTKKPQKKISSWEDLESKKVAYWNGLDLGAFTNTNIISIATSNESIRLKMLDSDRVDAILGFTPDVQLTASFIGVDVPHYDENFVILEEQESTILCHKNAANLELISEFNEEISFLKETGKLKEFLGKHSYISQ